MLQNQRMEQRRTPLWIVVGLVSLLALGLAAFWRLRAGPPATEDAPDASVAVAAAPDLVLPPAADSDAALRKRAPELSPRPELKAWMGEGDLIDRWTVVLDNLAEGVSPRRQLAFLAPRGPFRVLDKKGALEIDPRSYQRYDLFADVVASVDVRAFAALVQDVHGLLESAYHKLGYPDRKLDVVAARALQRVLDAPVLEGPIALQPKGAVLYRFADEKLESLDAVQKQLLRLGPRNLRLVQAKARELLQALPPAKQP